MFKIGLKWSKMVKMVKNDGPELKRARRTGLRDEVKRPEGPPARSQGPEGPKTSSCYIIEQYVRKCMQIT